MFWDGFARMSGFGGKNGYLEIMNRASKEVAWNVRARVASAFLTDVHSLYPLKEKAAGTDVLHCPLIDEKSRRNTVMKYLILGTALALALPLTTGIGVANAQDVRISVGDRDHGNWRGDGWRRHHWRGAYAYDRGCRVVVTERINRFGDRVTVRKRICH
jgi:hypothetical protein